MTFTEIVTQVSEDLNLQGNTEAVARIGRQINIRYKRIVSTLGLDTSKRTSSTQSASVGSTEITFTSIDKITRIADVTGGDLRLLKEVTWDELREEAPPDSDSPTRYAIKRVGATSVLVAFDVNFQTTDPSLRADGYETTSTLSGSTAPAFPEDFHDILVWGAKADELLKMEKTKLYEHAEAQFRSRLSELRLFLAKSNYLDRRQGSRAAGEVSSGGAGGGSSSVAGDTNYTQTGLITFDRDPLAPFAVTSGSAVVPNLDADKLDGSDWAAVGEAIIPSATNVRDLGSNAVRWRDLYISGRVAAPGIVNSNQSIDIARIKASGLLAFGGNTFDTSSDSSKWLNAANSYLTGASSATNTTNLWNFFAFELMDLVDILEYLLLSGDASLDVRGFTYTVTYCVAELESRSQDLLDIMNTATPDEIRVDNYIGLQSTLGVGYGALAGMDTYFMFHTYSPLEPIARFVTLNARYKLGASTAFLTDATTFFEDAFDQFESDWDTDHYDDPAEEAYQTIVDPGNVVPDAAYNMHASIGISLLHQYEATGNTDYLERAIQIGSYVRDSIFNDVWYYSFKRDRTEDPGHGSEVIRFLIALEERALMDSFTITLYLAQWSLWGINSARTFITDTIAAGAADSADSPLSLAYRYWFIYLRVPFLAPLLFGDTPLDTSADWGIWGDLLNLSTGSQVFANTGLKVYDTNASHYLTLKPGSNITDNRVLTITTGDADRTLTISGNAELNQNVTTGSSPAFVAASVNHIQFPASQVPSADANALDDYEETDWTPVLTFETPGNQSIILSTASGKATKIGRLVVINFNVQTSTFTHTTASGQLRITGCPITAASAPEQIGTVSWAGITKANYTQVCARFDGATSIINFIASGSGQARSAVAFGDCPTGGTVALYGSISFYV